LLIFSPVIFFLSSGGSGLGKPGGKRGSHKLKNFESQKIQYNDSNFEDK
jgi:hypothetical protein